ncbi:MULTISPECIES: serine/threonine protein kinase [unclassified Ruegeria]|uniref:serine/threonine protein kinase n=1 Tax=unclassified Ruegeria TaxID=2625375 RepID=UPI001ADA0B00|nr:MULTISPECIES: serine/threonine protein kinase [unclassified Ruegeria]MBO9413463.1 protein kinase [Ruegeria sp. R8_1]MBO9417354.1 protein kinase [Ruegeria sp. R8_2]
MTESRAGDLFQPGDLVNNTYRIEAILGRGGTSDVYRARSEISGRLAALKVLKAEFSSNDDYLVLLTREEEIRDIRHDAVVRYSENNRTADGHVYLVMDYVDGPGLDRKLADGPMSADDILTICKRVCEGLEAAHARNIVHRDLSPDNIILRDGDPAQAVIIDFGIAKDTNPGAETIVGGEFAGKYAYAAPEQLSGKTDRRTDIYSLGALLLANFRGEKANSGRNLLEVVESKKQPLDTADVPEPLKTVLDKMTAPDPDDRYQSASEVLRALSSTRSGQAESPPAETDDDATIIVPKSKPAAPAQPAPAVAAPAAPPVETPEKSRTKLVAALGALVIVGGGAGAYFSGAFDSFTGPQYPVAAPYTLVADKREGLPPRAVGFVPSEDTRDTMTREITDQGGTVDLTLASGEISESWGAAVNDVIETVMELDEWRLVVNGNDAQLTGQTTDQALHDKLEQLYSAGLPAGLQGTVELELEPLFLPAADIRPILASLADCGALKLENAPTAGYGPETPVQVSGTLASQDSLVGLNTALTALVGERPIDLDGVNVLNPTLCLIENYLPSAPASDISIAFFNGEQNDAPNPTGDFVVGQNPVIDVDLPQGVQDGFLSVSVLDVSGNVFHLLPNVTRQENGIAALRDGESGPVSVRVAYSIPESQENGGIAFQVDDSTLGKSKVIVLHTDNQLFDTLRPTTESAAGYAEALREQDRNVETQILSLDSRILTTLAQ